MWWTGRCVSTSIYHHFQHRPRSFSPLLHRKHKQTVNIITQANKHKYNKPTTVVRLRAPMSECTTSRSSVCGNSACQRSAVYRLCMISRCARPMSGSYAPCHITISCTPVSCLYSRRHKYNPCFLSHRRRTVNFQLAAYAPQAAAVPWEHRGNVQRSMKRTFTQYAEQVDVTSTVECGMYRQLWNLDTSYVA